MTDRKLRDDYVEQPYVEGYLHSRISSGDFPEYGYESNHLPETTGVERDIKTIFDIASDNSK